MRVLRRSCVLGVVLLALCAISLSIPAIAREDSAGPAIIEHRLLLVDTSRPTLTVPGHSKASPERRIPTLLLSPVHRTGRLPLVVFLHGINSAAATYLPFLTEVAGMGYVVAAPDSPETTNGTGLANIEDFTVLPGDAEFVIARLEHGVSGEPKRLVNPKEVAVAGQSFGGAGVYGLGFNSCCRASNVEALLSFEGALLPYQQGAFTWNGPPLLMVVGTKDPLIPLAGARWTLGDLQTPGYLLTLDGADHTGGLEPGEVGHVRLVQTVKEFLGATLEHRSTAEGWLADATHRSTSGLSGATVDVSAHPSSGTAR